MGEHDLGKSAIDGVVVGATVVNSIETPRELLARATGRALDPRCLAELRAAVEAHERARYRR